MAVTTVHDMTLLSVNLLSAFVLLPSAGQALRIAALWIAWLIVMLFHVELGLMPLFHGRSVQIETDVPVARLPRLFMAMLLYLMVPVLALLLAFHAAADPQRWSAAPGWRGVQWWLSLLYSFTNLIHLIADVRIPDARRDQIVLMSFLTLIGLMLNVETWLWWRG
jgi:hypothetical protein